MVEELARTFNIRSSPESLAFIKDFVIGLFRIHDIRTVVLSREYIATRGQWIIKIRDSSGVFLNEVVVSKSFDSIERESQRLGFITRINDKKDLYISLPDVVAAQNE